MKDFIVRNGEIEHVWKYRVIQHGFNTYVFCRGTSTEVAEYIESEYPEAGVQSWHHALSDAEVEMLQQLGLTVYIAPQK